MPTFRRITTPDRNRAPGLGWYYAHGTPEPLDRDFDDMWAPDDGIGNLRLPDDDE